MPWQGRHKLSRKVASMKNRTLSLFALAMTLVFLSFGAQQSGSLHVAAQTVSATVLATVSAAQQGTSGAPSVIPMPDSNTALLRIVHASPDAPAVDILIDGAAVASGLAFGQAIDYKAL